MMRLGEVVMGTKLYSFFDKGVLTNSLATLFLSILKCACAGLNEVYELAVLRLDQEFVPRLCSEPC